VHIANEKTAPILVHFPALRLALLAILPTIIIQTQHHIQTRVERTARVILINLVVVMA
jgi:hypothetical protein